MYYIYSIYNIYVYVYICPRGRGGARGSLISLGVRTNDDAALQMKQLYTKGWVASPERATPPGHSHNMSLTKAI